VTIERLTREGRQQVEDFVTEEIPITIILNGQELVTLLCSPGNLKYLAVGFLASEGLIKGKEEIGQVLVDDRRGVVRVATTGEKKDAGDLLFKRLITSGCGRGASLSRAADASGLGKVTSEGRFSAAEILNLTRAFQQRSEVYRSTGGVHSAALCDNHSILVFAEDIGRHNAVDKVFGQAILEDIVIRDPALITSGRISSEILLKVAKRQVPFLISRSAPTNAGVILAGNLGITLVGFVRGVRMNVYAGGWRLTSGS
jgi:FdhD protein